jgi:hypothetical protein
MERAHVSVHLGGTLAAIEAYRDAPTPNVIVLDAAGRGELVSHIDALAEFCDSGTRWSSPGAPTTSFFTASLSRAASANISSRLYVLEFIRAIWHLYASAGAKPRRFDGHLDRRNWLRVSDSISGMATVRIVSVVAIATSVLSRNCGSVSLK